MKISTSKLNTFSECPRKYWYSYELLIPTPKSEAFWFGGAVHSGLESYYKGLDAFQGFKDALRSKTGEQPAEGVNLDKLEVEGKRIFELYSKQVLYFQPVLIEHRFTVDLANPETGETLPAVLTGKIDLVTVDGYIIDHKTASRELSSDYQTNNLQVNGYAYAYWKTFGKMPKGVIFNQIIKGNSRREPAIKATNPIKPTVGDLCFFFQECKSAIDSIVRKETRDYPNPSFFSCQFCQYKNICQFKHKKVK
jgi:CRISPR/Cas system-associated exonuclease Cas4 (RecB family)